MSEKVERVDLNSLRLRYNAEFDDWQEFVSAVDEFQRATNIKLTITTSKRLSPSERAKKRQKNDGILITVVDEEQSKERFEYKYLKLTCKHYGGYRSTSRGIRPNQKTVKLMCPTYIYGSFDNCKDRFCIKQMVVNCNHELKDEEVLLPKLLKDPSSETSNDGNTPKKYVRKRNRNVLKVPLESPTSGTLIVSLKSKVKCNHESNSSCEAYSLTSYDLSSIISQFNSKCKEEQNELILQWIDVSLLKVDDKGDEDKIQVQFRLPTIDDTLIKVCSKSFLSILNVNMNRVDSVISSHYSQRFTVAREQTVIRGNQEVETSIATILTSLSREEPGTQVLYIDHVDLPSAEDTIEDPFIEPTSSLESNEVNSNSTVTVNTSTESEQRSDDNTDKRWFLGSFPWFINENNLWANNPYQTGVYTKVDSSRGVVLLDIVCRNDYFEIKVYNQPLNYEKIPVLKNFEKHYAANQASSVKPLLDRLNSLTLCRGLQDSRLKSLLETLKEHDSEVELSYCFHSDSYRSNKCELLFGDEWCSNACRECDAIAELLRLK